MKRVYVAVVRAVGQVLALVGLMRILDVWARRSRAGAWFRSLLAIYDIRALVALDMPWWTFDSAEHVAEYLSRCPDAAVFEWGSGASTVWLAKRAATVTTVEHDSAWAAQVRPLLGSNAKVVTVMPTPAADGSGVRSRKRGHEGLDFAAYVSAIDDHAGPFDLIVIDGRAREACLRRAVPKLADGGLIVFDNVDRQRYRDAIMAERSVDVQITRGLTPALPYPTRTALIRKSEQS